MRSSIKVITRMILVYVELKKCLIQNLAGLSRTPAVSLFRLNYVLRLLCDFVEKLALRNKWNACIWLG